jgi:hypothetical protein
MPQFLLKIAAVKLLMLAVIGLDASASHMAGGFIRYQSTGVPHQYNINLTLYRDCSGMQLTIDPVIYFRRTCGGTAFGETLVFNTSSGQAVPQYCANTPSRCNGGSRYGLQKYVWEGIVTLPYDASNPDCNRWTLTWGNNSVDGFSARNNSSTLLNGGGTDFFIDAYLDDNVLNPQSAPLFVDSLVPAYCINQPVAVNFNAVDPDGDSLAFSLVPAQSAYNTPVVYAPGYSAVQPALSTGGISVNQANGNITFTTLNPQITLFVLRMEKYRNGVLIGYIKFDVQVLLGAFPYCTPVYSTVALTGCAQVNLPSGPVSQSGTYVDSFFSAECKDSIVTYQVTINQPSSSTIHRVVCAPGAVIVGTQSFSASGVYMVTLSNSVNCDSVVTLNLTVKQPSSFQISQSVCAPTVVSVDTFTFGTTGTYQVTLVNSAGCDSLITLNLIVNPTYSVSIDSSVCAPQTITVGSNTYNSNGTFVVPLLSRAGCDSIVTLNMTVRQPSRSYHTDTACDQYVWNGQTITQTGRYTRILRNAVDCDSTVELDVLVEQTPLRPIEFDTMVCARSYLPIPYPGTMRGRLDWYADQALTQLIGTGSVLPVEIIQDTTELFLVFRSAIGCTSPVARVLVVNEDEQLKRSLPNAFTPNADNINDVWEVSWNYPLELMVFDRWGLLVWKDEGLTVRWDGGNCTPGAYPYILGHTGCTGRKRYKNGIIHLVK